MADRKIIDEAHHITPKRGNGQLRREVWVDELGRVTRYNLAYVNRALYSGDNGRVVGKGKHSDLMRSCETYQEIANSQLSEEELA